ncbi:MAG: DUF4199 domain-containing protein [Opitutaceae bacterium]|nr:DUF4199 domain-containing protein [Opitutaceae bacterium]
MKTYAFYGAGAALATFFLTALIYFLGLHSDVSKLSLAGWIMTVGGLTIFILALVLGVREVRSTADATKDYTYANAFAACFFITLFSSIFGVFTNLLYTMVVNPGFQDLILQGQIAQMQKQGMPQDQINASTEMMRRFNHPAISSAMNFIAGLVIGTIISLIVAIFLKRKAGQEEQLNPLA